jgi:hypothetical protein
MPAEQQQQQQQQQPQMFVLNKAPSLYLPPGKPLPLSPAQMAAAVSTAAALAAVL